MARVVNKDHHSHPIIERMQRGSLLIAVIQTLGHQDLPLTSIDTYVCYWLLGMCCCCPHSGALSLDLPLFLLKNESFVGLVTTSLTYKLVYVIDPVFQVGQCVLKQP